MATPPTPTRKPRPVWFNLHPANLPLPAVVSILHRVSGAVLFLFGIPLLLWALHRSLTSEGFALLAAMFARPLVKLGLIGFVWAWLHHFFAGIRYLLLDLDKGIELAPARQSSVIVLAVSLVLTLIVGVRLW